MSEQTEKDTIRADLKLICEAILKDGSDPVKQLSGYILSEDPTYIPDIDGARRVIRRLDRDDILAALILNYFE